MKDLTLLFKHITFIRLLIDGIKRSDTPSPVSVVVSTTMSLLIITT